MWPTKHKSPNTQIHSGLDASLLRGRTGAVLKINGSFIMASFLTWVTWELWNWDTDFYGVTLGVFIGVLFSISYVCIALIQIGKLYERERAIASYVSQGYKPKTSELAGNDALDKAGMR